MNKQQKDRLEYIVATNDLFYSINQERRLRNIEFQKKILGLFKSFLSGVGFVIRMLMCAFFSALIGLSSKPIIYLLNQPLGQGYALIASYMTSGLAFFLIYYGFRRDK